MFQSGGYPVIQTGCAERPHALTADRIGPVGGDHEISLLLDVGACDGPSTEASPCNQYSGRSGPLSPASDGHRQAIPANVHKE
jgi:hypothetical protein